MSRVLSALLTLALVLTAQGMAVAKGSPSPAGVMVICSGGVSVTVAVDAEGRPTGPAHLCPDCALAMLDGAPAPAAEARVSDLEALAFTAPAARTIAPIPPVSPPARGPPAAV